MKKILIILTLLLCSCSTQNNTIASVESFLTNSLSFPYACWPDTSKMSDDIEIINENMVIDHGNNKEMSKCMLNVFDGTTEFTEQDVLTSSIGTAIGTMSDLYLDENAVSKVVKITSKKNEGNKLAYSFEVLLEIKSDQGKEERLIEGSIQFNSKNKINYLSIRTDLRP